MMRRVALVAAAAAVGLAASSLPAEGAGKTKKITVSDDFYAPTKVTVDRGTTIKWVWGEDVNSHDVKLKSGPSGVRKFHSGAAAGQYTFSRKLTTPGTYKVVCTLHEGMTMKIVVRK